MAQLTAEEKLQIEIEPHANKNMVVSVAEGVLDVADALKSNKGQGGNALSIIDADDE